MAALTSEPVLAAQYLRMSRDHQRYSISNQAAAVAIYARERGLKVVRTYEDAGISGLTLRSRPALRQLLADVMAGDPGFSVILTYDVSRWGRFQDPDQSAHYEFICREAGVNVEYCQEPFDNDGSVSSSLLKSLKRVMAAEFSRELSAKLALVKARVAREGFWAGGPAGYGLRRRIVSADGQPGRILERGERKAITSERTVLVPGPPHEVETVQRMFRLYVINGLNFTGIARQLNAEGETAEGGALWTMNRVRQVITNEKYAGVNVYGRRKSVLGKGTRPRDREAWQRAPGAFTPIVPAEIFDLANANAWARRAKPKVSDQVLLDTLRKLLAETGSLGAAAMRTSPYAYSPSVYQRRFGSLSRAYELVGYTPSRKQRLAAVRARGVKRSMNRYFIPDLLLEDMLDRLRGLYRRLGYLSVRAINDAPDLPSAHRYRVRFGGMRRAYALVGYQPPRRQEFALEVRGGQTISLEQAREIAASVAAED